MNMRIFLIWLLFCPVVMAQTITTARGDVEVNDGDVVCAPLYYNKDTEGICTVKSKVTMWSGTVDGLNDVTFIGCNFSRKSPHSVVFTNSTNLTFIACNMTNVEGQSDFKYGPRTPHFHVEEKDVAGETHRIVERHDNKTVTYILVETEFDLIEEEYGITDPTEKAKISAQWQKEGRPITRTDTAFVEDSVSNTANDKLIKGSKLLAHEITDYNDLLKMNISDFRCNQGGCK